ncbi:MAG TPA: hypothetical protein VE111_20855 [Bradyrhizobium sp.]|nr:hypothetical protein [Bradyrhizobium sp.]
MPNQACNVAYWHKCEVADASGNVRVREQSGTHLLAASISHLASFPLSRGIALLLQIADIGQANLTHFKSARA